MAVTREICKMCYHVNPIGFYVSDYIWEKVVPEEFRSGVVCINCFTRLGDEKLVEWDNNIKLYPVSLHSHLYD